MAVVAVGEPLRKSALFAHRAQQRDQFYHHQRRGEAAQRIGAVKAPGDEQEGQPRDQPQDEAKEILPSALGQRGQVLVGFFVGHSALPCSARSGRDSSADTTARGSSPLSRS